MAQDLPILIQKLDLSDSSTTFLSSTRDNFVLIIWRNLAAFLVWFFLASFALPELHAQRLYERGAEIMLEDAEGRMTSLGPGFNGIPISDHKLLFLRGARMGYGEESSCERPAARNRVVIYDVNANMCRLHRKPTEADPRVADYKYIHARPDGTQIAIISGEDLVLVGGNGAAPILRNYLRCLHGRIFVQGEWVP